MEIFKSKVDWWIGILLALAPISGFAVVGLGLGTDEDPTLYSGIALSAVVLLIYWFLVFPMEYEVHPDKLVVRYGRVRERYPYENIVEIYPTRNFLSSAALSLKRLRVKPRTRWGVLISPVDREAFYAAILKQTDQLKREGDRLVEVGDS